MGARVPKMDREQGVRKKKKGKTPLLTQNCRPTVLNILSTDTRRHSQQGPVTCDCDCRFLVAAGSLVVWYSWALRGQVLGMGSLREVVVHAGGPWYLKAKLRVKLP